jgi:hypothetical protein
LDEKEIKEMARVALKKLSIGELQRELARRQGALPRLQKKRRKLAAALKKVDDAIAALGGAAAPRKAVARRGRPAGKVRRVRNAQSLGDVLVKILARVKSMKIAELVGAVKRTGYKSKAKNFRLIVNQALVKDKRFRNVRRGRYALSKAARAPAKKSAVKKARRRKAASKKASTASSIG